MFQVIFIKGDVSGVLKQLPIPKRIIYSALIEYQTQLDMTFVYLFQMNQINIQKFLKLIANLEYVYKPVYFHDAYAKDFYYHRDDEMNTNQSIYPLFKDYQLLSKIKEREVKNFLFLEINKRRNRIKELVSYTNINDLKQILKEQYALKYVIPFYYCREMKAYYQEKRIPVERLDWLYVLEYKSLQGRKR